MNERKTEKESQKDANHLSKISYQILLYEIFHNENSSGLFLNNIATYLYSLKSAVEECWKIPRRREEYSVRSVRTRIIHTRLESKVHQHVAIKEAYKEAVCTYKSNK